GTPPPRRRAGVDRSGRRRRAPRSTRTRPPAAPAGPSRASRPRSDGAQSNATGRPLAGERPSIAHVGRLLLVPGAVRELDRDAAALLVEVPGLHVVLEGPEAEALRPLVLRELEERRADAFTVRLRVDVEERPEVSVESEEAGNAPV